MNYKELICKPLLETFGNKRSNCCHSPIYNETDICSECGEHCEVENKCETCKGEGIIRHYFPYIPPYGGWVEWTCDECKGEGWK